MDEWIQNAPKIRGIVLTPYLKTLETIDSLCATIEELNTRHKMKF